MDSSGVNDASGSISKHLISLLGDDVVLVWANKGQKGPRWRGWQHTGIDRMRKTAYLKTLDCGHNIAVLTGAPSGGLCSIDIDENEAVEPFLTLNPRLRETLRSCGKRGCNLWVRIQGVFPPPADIRTADENAWGEWRSTGVNTTVHGIHPEGMSYERSPEVPPVTMTFDEIVWPEGLKLPWLDIHEELPPTGEESDDPIIEQYGKPVVLGRKKSGESYVKDIPSVLGWPLRHRAHRPVRTRRTGLLFVCRGNRTLLGDLAGCDQTGRFLAAVRDVTHRPILAAA